MVGDPIAQRAAPKRGAIAMKRPSTKPLSITIPLARALLTSVWLLSLCHSAAADQPAADRVLAEAQSRARTHAVTGLLSRLESTTRPTTAAAVVAPEAVAAQPAVPARPDEPGRSDGPATRSMPASPTTPDAPTSPDALVTVQLASASARTVTAKTEPIAEPAAVADAPVPAPSTEERTTVQPTPTAVQPMASTGRSVRAPIEAMPRKTAGARSTKVQRGNPNVAATRREQMAEIPSCSR
jgi:hypothetical protein